MCPMMFLEISMGEFTDLHRTYPLYRLEKLKPLKRPNLKKEKDKRTKMAVDTDYLFNFYNKASKMDQGDSLCHDVKQRPALDIHTTPSTVAICDARKSLHGQGCTMFVIYFALWIKKL